MFNKWLVMHSVKFGTVLFLGKGTYNVAELATAMLNVNPGFTPLEIAILTKELYANPEDVVDAVLGAFPTFSATEMGKLLLDSALYPNTNSDEMKQLLRSGDYPDSEILEALQVLYGKPALPIEVSFYETMVISKNASVQTGPGTMYNDYYKRSWIMHYPGQSFIQVDFNPTKTGFTKVNLSLYHLTSMLWERNGFSPIDILINGQIFLSRYDVVNGNYQLDCFDITPLVREGSNTIRLNFCLGATSNYWIQSLKVDFV